MAIEADFSVAVNGDIRHESGTAHYTVLELHRFLQDIADDESPATANDYVDITSLTPSDRSTDNIITLINGYNIDDDAAEYFYDGSITQDDGDTVYSGLKVLGAVNNVNTQLMVIQDNDYYQFTTTPTAPFWGDQSTGGYNGDAAGGVLMRILIKTRQYGADIDKKRIRVQARAWGDSYDFFTATLGQGEGVAAIGTTPDAQNTTEIATVQGWAGGDIPTNAEGYQTIDINNGDGAQPYYSKWTYNTNAAAMKAIWEYIKEITGNDSPEAAAPHGMNGELFLGITHSYAYDGDSGVFTEDETVVWGTDITYDGLTGGTFAVGDYVLFKRASVLINAGKVLYDNGTTNMIVALESTSALAEDDVITEASAETVSADCTATILDNTKSGGEGILLAEDATGDKQYIQVVSGLAPVDDLPIRGITSAATCLVAGAVTARTIPKIFLGSYTGTLIGAYGIGIDPDDLVAADRVQDLGGTTRIPPNNVTFVLSGLVSGQDRILVGPKDTGNNFKWAEMVLAAALDTGTETIVDVGTGNIPADAPATGVLRITLDDGRIRRIAYTSHDGDDEFTIAESDWLEPDDAGIGNGVMLSFIDKLAESDTEEFTLQFDEARSLWIRVRDGGASPIKTYESAGTLGITGGSAIASRISDA